MHHEDKAGHKKADSHLAVERAIRFSKEGRVSWEKAARLTRDSTVSPGCEKLHDSNEDRSR